VTIFAFFEKSQKFPFHAKDFSTVLARGSRKFDGFFDMLACNSGKEDLFLLRITNMVPPIPIVDFSFIFLSHVAVARSLVL
jgi:hypothetical protein